MIAGTLNDICVYKGALFEHDIELFDDETESPLDLTGLGPFVATFQNDSGKYNAVVTSAYDDTGIINITLGADITKDFALGVINFGVRDDQNRPYIETVLNVKRFTPDPNLTP